jgi:glyoxylase-like metal-dependent hydrolase (beta-lactamase superfamily II)
LNIKERIMVEPATRTQEILGGTTVTFIPDGEVRLAPEVLFPKSGDHGWDRHAPYLDSDGRLPVSVGSFLVRTSSANVLVDLGLGNVDFDVPGLAHFRGGALLDSLAAEGLRAGDIDAVIYTHLHHDHVGWTSTHAPAPNVTRPERAPALTFTNARHFVHPVEWKHWLGVDELTGPDVAAVQNPLKEVVEFIDESRDVLPGIRAIPTHGHTPGHVSLLVNDPASSERLLVLGDVMHSQVQIAETDWSFLFDSDPARGTQVRIELLQKYTDAHTIIAGGHFAGSVFGRFLSPATSYRWAARRALASPVTDSASAPDAAA